MRRWRFRRASIARPPDSRLPALLQVRAEAPRPRSTRADHRSPVSGPNLGLLPRRTRAGFRAEPAPVSCRSAGRRECGVGDFDARRSPDRPIRACRRSYRCVRRRRGRGQRAPITDRPFPDQTWACFRAEPAPVSAPNPHRFHVGAPAGANAALEISTHVECATAQFAPAGAPTFSRRGIHAPRRARGRARASRGAVRPRGWRAAGARGEAPRRGDRSAPASRSG